MQSLKMEEAIINAKNNGNSVGGVLETVVLGLPAGVGEPFFDSLESRLAHALFSIPAVKGVEFGLGFGITDLFGSEANDNFYYDDGKVKTRTNNNGGYSSQRSYNNGGYGNSGFGGKGFDKDKDEETPVRRSKPKTDNKPREQQPDKFEIINRIEKEKKAMKKKHTKGIRYAT